MDEILLKHFMGHATAAEEKNVESWRANHAQEYEALKKAWSEPYKPSGRRFDPDTAWARVARETLQKRPATLAVRGSWLKYGIAAAILLLIGMAVLWPVKSTADAAAMAFENNTALPREIILPDSSHVWLNQHAKINYSSNNGIRQLSLSGEAFFEVTKDPDHPFTISTTQGSVTVLGTSFNVEAGSRITRVSVKTGLVRLSAGSSAVVLKKNETAFATQKKVSDIKTAAANYLAWKTGEFTFERTTLPELVKSLNTYYKNRFEYSGSDSLACKITAHFSNNSVEEIEQAIQLICGTQVIHKGGKVLFR